MHDEFIEGDSFEKFNNGVIDYKQCLKSTSDLAKFWLSYLSMVEILLKTLYATQSGDLLFECSGRSLDMPLHTTITITQDT